MNRTDVGRQMVGDLGNFVGQDIHSQFSRKPQKLAEGDIVEGEVSVGDDLGGEGSVTAIDAETGEITYTYEAKTGEGGYEMRPGRSFKYNPEDGYGFPSTSGRRRLIKKGQVSAAGQGSPEYFKTAEAIEVEAAPAAAAAPPQEKPPPPPLNLPTDADEAETREDRSQMTNPLPTHPKLMTDKDVHTRHDVHQGIGKVATRILGKGLIPYSTDAAAKEFLMTGKNTGKGRHVTNYSNPDLPSGRVTDTRDTGIGLSEKQAKKEIAAVRDRHGLGKDDPLTKEALNDVISAGKTYIHPLHDRGDTDLGKGLSGIRQGREDLEKDEEEAERDKENTEAEKRLEEAKGPLRATLQQLVGKLGNIGHGAYGRGVNVDYGTGMPSGDGAVQVGIQAAPTVDAPTRVAQTEADWQGVQDYWSQYDDSGKAWADIQEAENIASTLDNDSLSGQMMMNRGGPIPFARGGGLSSMVQPDQHINPGDFVISSDVVSGVGDGSSEFGVQRLSEEFGIPQSGPFQAALGGEVRGPGGGLDDFLQTSVAGKKAALLSNQEMVVPRDIVAKAALKNNPKLSPQQALKQGQNMFYNLMTNVRSQKNQTTGGNQPSKLKGSLASLTNPIKNRG